jgi:putative transposase
MRYETDLTDAQWAIIAPILRAKIGNYGNRAKWSKRAVIDAILYLVKTGCQWRMLPRDFPPYSTVHSFFRRARLSGLWEEILAVLVVKSRILDGRSPIPSYAIIDSQSVKTTGAAIDKGIDGGKKS